MLKWTLGKPQKCKRRKERNICKYDNKGLVGKMRNNQLISGRRSVSVRRLNNSISHFFCFLTPFQYNGCNHLFFMLPTYQSKINTHSHWACNDSSTPKMFTLNTSCESAIWWCYILQCKREELQCVQYVYKWTASFFATFCKQAVTLFVQTQMTALRPSVLSSLRRNVNYLHIFPLSWCPVVNVGLIKHLWLLVWQIKYPSVHLDSMQSHWQHTSCESWYRFWLRYASLQHLPLPAVAEMKHLLEISL